MSGEAFGCAGYGVRIALGLPADFDELPEPEREIYEVVLLAVAAEGNPLLPDDNSVERPCPLCGTRLLVGPSVNRAMDEDSSVQLMCPLCFAAHHSGAGYELVSLGEALSSGEVDDVIDNVMEPQLRAQGLQERGVDVQVAEVDTHATEGGFVLRCIGCGRTAHTSVDPGDKVGMCPRCLRKQRSEGD